MIAKLSLACMARAPGAAQPLRGGTLLGPASLGCGELFRY